MKRYILAYLAFIIAFCAWLQIDDDMKLRNRAKAYEDCRANHLTIKACKERTK